MADATDFVPVDEKIDVTPVFDDVENFASDEELTAKVLKTIDDYEGRFKGQRSDYERLLKIVGEDGLRGLLDRVTKLGYRGLPAIGAVGTAGAVLGSSASKDGSEPGRYD